MALEKELQTYQTALPSLLQNAQGKFVLIHGEEIEGVYDSYEDALKIGYTKFGLDEFLVKKVQEFEAILSFTRDLCPI